MCGRLLAQRDLDPTGRRHARTLVPEIQSLLTDADRTAGDLELIAVSIGPGSFTGLRVGVVCAKTLAWAIGAKLVGSRHVPRDRVAVAGRRRHASRSSATASAAICTSVATAAPQHGDWIRDGDDRDRARRGLARTAHRRPTSSPAPASNATPMSPPHAAASCRANSGRRCASTIAYLGEQRALTGTTDDLWSIEPFYLRKSGAEEKAEIVSRVDGRERELNDVSSSDHHVSIHIIRSPGL